MIDLDANMKAYLLIHHLPECTIGDFSEFLLEQASGGDYL